MIERINLNDQVSKVNRLNRIFKKNSTTFPGGFYEARTGIWNYECTTIYMELISSSSIELMLS